MSTMAVKFEVVVIPGYNDRHPLHVGLTPLGRKRLFDEGKDDKYCIIALRQFEIDPLLYVTSYIANLSYLTDIMDIENEETACVYVTKYFLTHYRLDESKAMLLQTANPLPLEKVIFTTRNRRIYDVIVDSDFLGSMLEVLRSYATLVRKNDVLLAPIIGNDELSITGGHDVYLNMECLDCQPFLQGLLTEQTEIVIINKRDDRIAGEEQDEEEPHVHTNSDDLLDDNCMMVSQFLSNSQITHNRSEMDESIASIDDSFVACAPIKYHVKILTEPVCITDHLDLRSVADGSYRIGVTFSTLSSMNYFNGSWVNISVTRSSDASVACQLDRKWRLVQLIAVDRRDHQVKTDDFVYLSPLLLFNLLDNPTDMIDESSLLAEMRLPGNDELKIPEIDRESRHISKSLCYHGDPPYAAKVSLSVVVSPNVSSSMSFVNILTDFFKQPRLVAEGDIICVKLDVAQPLLLKPNFTERASIVYFKVNKITSSWKVTCYLADTVHTSLFQDGPCHGYVPIRMDAFLGIPSSHPLPGLANICNKLQTILLPYLFSSATSKSDMLLPSVIMSGPRSSGKSAVIRSVCRKLNIHIVDINAYDCCGDTSSSTEARLQSAIKQGITYRPCALLLRNIETIFKGPSGFADPRIIETLREYLFGILELITDYPLVVIATTTSLNSIPAPVFGSFLHEIYIESPNEAERLKILTALTSETPLKEDVDLNYLAKRTAGMVLGDFMRLLSHSKRMAHARYLKCCDIESTHANNNHTKNAVFDPEIFLRESYEVKVNASMAGAYLQFSDFEQSLELMQSMHSDAIGAPKIPNVTWDDVGGLAKAKAEILDTIQLPLQHPEILAAGLRRSGLLFYGPPGTGKTLLAKAVATECSLNFLSVKGPELINMYVGQSEENVREVFERARRANPCVIFFDELDSLAPNRGRSGDSGGVMDRVVSQLLAELDGLNTSANVFVIGATNRPDLIDPALLRPGRFDKLVYLGVSEDHESQLKILEALTRKLNLDENFMLEEFVRNCPLNLTGADFYALCSDAMFNAVKNRIDRIESGIGNDNDEVVITGEDFNSALTNLTPSISIRELDRYQQIKTKYKNS